MMLNGDSVVGKVYYLGGELCRRSLLCYVAYKRSALWKIFANNLAERDVVLYVFAVVARTVEESDLYYACTVGLRQYRTTHILYCAVVCSSNYAYSFLEHFVVVRISDRENTKFSLNNGSFTLSFYIR